MTPPARTSLVLASASPRRRDLLAQLGLRFTVDPADVDESVQGDEAPDAYVLRLAAAKAKRVAQRHPSAIALAADTTVVRDREILGKPADAEDAVRILRSLSGREHVVYTAIAVAGAAREAQMLVETRVRMRPATDAELAWYVATGEPMDKAGAYGLQGMGAFLVESVSGSPTSVIGLPLPETLALLASAGLTLPWMDAGTA